MTWLESFSMLLGRILMASYFFISGVSKVSSFENSLALYQKQEVPYAGIFLYISTLFLILGAFFIFFGYRTRLGAFLLILALLPTTFIFHHFWNQEGDDLVLAAAFFFKDIAIVGGLLYIIARGGGLCSIDAFRKAQKAKAAQLNKIIQ